MSYQKFIENKTILAVPTGLHDVSGLPPKMLPHQVDLTKWALRRGRAAIFADTGLGKSFMEISWANAIHQATGRDVIILAPLAVAAQTVSEGVKFGVKVNHARDGADVVPGINVTNYDRLHRFDPSAFGAVVLDESSCIKHHTSKTFDTLVEAFAGCPYRLCATATPAPNDWTELGTHAEFLGICTRSEMLAEYFVHDGGDTQTWRLKGHARAMFWQWVASWGAMVRKPSDLGHDDSLYNLPPLNVTEHLVDSDDSGLVTEGMLFALEASSMSERRAARKASMPNRVNACVQKIKSEWYKLADNSQEIQDDVEAGIRGEQKAKRACRPESSGEEASVSFTESGKEQGISEDVHEGVLRSESREVPVEDKGAARQVQRKSEEKVCRGRGIQGEGQGSGEITPDQKEGHCSDEKLRTDDGVIRYDSEVAERGLRDMRALGSLSQNVSYGRSLSLDRKDSGDSLLELQHGSGEIQGLSGQASICNFLSSEQWVIWCNLNAEQDALEEAFGELAFSVRGADTSEEKESRLLRWLSGERPVIISKTSIMGFGINMQCARNVAFLSMSDSWESYYQATRRCWRFGQKRPVNVHLFSSNLEGAVLANLKRKEADAAIMGEALSAETNAAVRAQVIGQERTTNIHSAPHRVAAPSWLQGEIA